MEPDYLKTLELGRHLKHANLIGNSLTVYGDIVLMSKGFIAHISE